MFRRIWKSSSRPKKLNIHHIPHDNNKFNLSLYRAPDGFFILFKRLKFLFTLGFLHIIFSTFHTTGKPKQALTQLISRRHVFVRILRGNERIHLEENVFIVPYNIHGMRLYYARPNWRSNWGHKMTTAPVFDVFSHLFAVEGEQRFTNIVYVLVARFNIWVEYPLCLNQLFLYYRFCNSTIL